MGEPQEKEELPLRPPVDENAFTAEQLARLETVLGWFEQMETKHFSGFLPALAEAGCQLTRMKDDFPYLAAFGSYHETTGDYGNLIEMSPQSLTQGRELFHTFAHEGVHALQSAHCAAMHALPQNRRTVIMLCPRDYIYLKELCERDAYPKESLADLGLEGWRRKTGGEATPIKDLGNETYRLACILQDHDVKDALAEAGERTLLVRRRPLTALPENYEDIRSEDGTISYKDKYNRQALFQYLSIVNIRSADLEQGRLVFARLEPEDIIALGAAFGPNPFTDENGALRPGLETPSPLHPDNEDILQALNDALGIADEADLPTFGQALEAQGLDREAFLRAAILPPLPDTPQNAFKPLDPGPKPA